MRHASPLIIAALLCIFLLPPLYVASCGPAIWCRDHGLIPQSTLVTVYAPVGRVAVVRRRRTTAELP